jgi:hypothetical protein
MKKYPKIFPKTGMIDFSDPKSSASLFTFISVSAAKKLKAFPNDY